MASSVAWQREQSQSKCQLSLRYLRRSARLAAMGTSGCVVSRGGVGLVKWVVVEKVLNYSS